MPLLGILGSDLGGSDRDEYGPSQGGRNGTGTNGNGSNGNSSNGSYLTANGMLQPRWPQTGTDLAAATELSADAGPGQPSGDAPPAGLDTGIDTGIDTGQQDRQLGVQVGVQVGRRGEERDRRLGGLVSRCANPRCDAGWLRFWRRRRLPVFEGGWCCSERCTRALVAEAVSREMRARGAGIDRHRHRIPLGLLMVERGWINGKQLQQALKMQRSAGAGRLGHWLVRQGSIDESTVARAVGSQWGCPVLNVESYSPEALTSIMPRLFLDAFGALPLRVAAGKILYLGFEERLDPALALAVERMTGLKVESGLVPDSMFRAAHSRTLNARFPGVQLVDAASAPAIAATLTRTIEKALPVDSRLVRVHDCLWLRMWLRPQQGAVPELDGVRDVIYSAGGA